MSGLSDVVSTITVGGVGVWATFGMLLLAWWKGLPKFIPTVITAVTERNKALAEGFDFQIERLETQLAASDKRHADCMAGQDSLRREVDELRRAYETLRTQWLQQQSSIVATLPGSVVSQTIQEASQRADVIRHQGHE